MGTILNTEEQNFLKSCLEKGRTMRAFTKKTFEAYGLTIATDGHRMHVVGELDLSIPFEKSEETADIKPVFDGIETIIKDIVIPHDRVNEVLKHLKLMAKYKKSVTTLTCSVESESADGELSGGVCDCIETMLSDGKDIKVDSKQLYDAIRGCHSKGCDVTIVQYKEDICSSLFITSAPKRLAVIAGTK
jgi:hypothetical protein